MPLALYAELGGKLYPHEQMNALIARFAKPETPTEEIANFEIEPREGSQGHEGQYFCWETHLGLKLVARLEGRTRAIAGIGFHVREETILIRQVQGFRHAAPQLSKIRWIPLLMNAVDLFARQNNAERLLLLNPKELAWYYEPVHLSPLISLEQHQRMLKGVYRGAARSIRMKWCATRQCYLKTYVTGSP